MVKRTVTYTDFDGVQRTEDFYFNLTKSELVKMEASVDGGLKNKLEKLMASPSGKEIMQYFNEILMMSYGVKSDDGRRFMKSKEISEAFEQTPAYDEIFMELVTDSEKALKFINSVIPDMSDLQPKTDPNPATAIVDVTRRAPYPAVQG